MATGVTRITASVGRMGGVNRPEDVKKVQELLNKVPSSEGGPNVPLAVDGLCGPKTIEAIQAFQLHHFGWNGADGRVDPYGPTLAKLDEYNVAGTHAYMLSIRCVLEPGRFLDPLRPEHWFFEIREVGQRPRGIYHLSGEFEHPPVSVPTVFLGEEVTFPCSRWALAAESRAADYMTTYDVVKVPGQEPHLEGRPVLSTLKLGFLSESPGAPVGVERVEIIYPADIEPPVIAEKDPNEVSPMVRKKKWGRFNLVKSLQG